MICATSAAAAFRSLKKRTSLIASDSAVSQCLDEPSTCSRSALLAWT